MASKYWIKLYHEILHDHKMGTMPDKLWRHTIEFFLLAGEVDRDGELPPVDEIAWTLRISNEECNVSLHELQRLHIVHCNDNKTWVVTNFTKRQDASTGTERSREFRRRKRHNDSKLAQNTPENDENGATEMQRKVAPDTDTDTDTDILPNGNSADAPPTNKKPKKAIPPEDETLTAGPKKQLMGFFQQKTHLTLPRSKSELGFWWSKIAELYAMASDDLELSKQTVSDVIGYMQAEGLTIKGPESIVGMCRARIAGQTFTSKNGSGNRAIGAKLTDEQRQRIAEIEAEDERGK